MMSRWDGLSYENNIGKSYFWEVSNHSTQSDKKKIVVPRATENRFFAGSDRFLVRKTDSICIKRIFFGPKKKTHFADHILAQFPGLVKCPTVNCT